MKQHCRRDFSQHMGYGRWIVVAAAVACMAADWPGFRGADGSGRSADVGLPESWSASEHILWKTELPGAGASSPIVVGDRLFLTCYSGYGVDPNDPGDPEKLKRHVLGLSRRDGRVLWKHEPPSRLPAQEYEGFLTEHGYASSTPVCDGKRLYVFFGRSGLFAYDLDGKPLWHAEVGDGKHGWGSAASPVVFEGLVIVNAFVESRSLIALDGESGKEVWRLGGLSRSWSTPIVVAAADGSPELVLSMQGQVWGVDPTSGERLWTCEGIDDYVCASPVSKGDVVYVIGGRRGRALAIRVGGRGDVTDTHLIWQADVGSNVPSPVVWGDHLYWVDHRGLAYCLDAATGEVVYRERLRGAGRVYASPVVADGRLYAVTRERGTFVVAASPEFELIGVNDLSPDASIFNASPAVADRTIYLRSNRAVYAIGSR